MPDLDEMLERSLRRAGAEYRTGRSDAAGTFTRRYRVRRARTLASAAVALALVVGGATFAVQHATRSTDTIGPARGSVVPWKPLPPVSTQPASQQSAPSAVGLPFCRIDQLALGELSTNGASGWQENLITVADTSATSCKVDGVPTVRLIGADGHALSLAQTSPSYFWFPERGTGPVALLAHQRPAALGDGVPLGQTALFFTLFDCERRLDNITRIELSLPGSGGTKNFVTEALASSYPAYCDGSPKSPRRGIEVNPFQHGDVPEPGAPVWARVLKIALDAPSTARRGTTLLYTVTFTNPTSGDVAFDPCPAYAESIAGRGIKAVGRYGLNCADGRHIPPGESLTFEMHLDVPATTGAGTATLQWSSEIGTLSATRPIDIV